MKRKIGSVLILVIFFIFIYIYAKHAEKERHTVDQTTQYQLEDIYLKKISGESSDEERLTVDQAAEYLLEYIYPGMDAYSLCTIYYEENDEAMDTVYNTTRYPDYEFDYLEQYGSYTRKQLYCAGESGEYLIFYLLSWIFSTSAEGERVPNHANFIQSYAIHRGTKEIIEERIRNIDGMWDYNDAYVELEHELVIRESYD